MRLAKIPVLCTVVGLILSLVSCAQSAYAGVMPEVGVGVSQYSTLPDGIWYQAGMPNRLQLSGRAFKVGLTGDLNLTDRSGIAWHADYVNLGHIRSFCDCTTIDADYSTAMKRLTVPGAPRAIYSGNGMVQGIKLSLAPYFRLGAFRVGFEEGVFVYRPEFKDSVYGWHASPGGPYVNGSVTSPTRRQFSAVFGFFISRGRFTLSYEHYHMSAQRNEFAAPPLWNGAQVLMLSYAL